MVHRDIGSARITYPTGVKVSPVDPMTSANLPRELRVVPGVVSRPIRLGAGKITASQHIAQFLAQANGDAYQAATLATLARMRDPHNIPLRNAEHALFSQYAIKRLGPVLGRAVVASAVPAYSLAKVLGRPIGFFKGATPPSWQEVQYGLQPIVSSVPALTITGYATVGTWPGAVLSTPGDCNAYLGTHGGGKGCQAVYSNGTLGPVIPYTAPSGGLSGVDYYPNLGQDAGAAPGYWPASVSGVPTWVWWVGSAGLIALLLGGGFFATGAARQRPRVRTVTRTTY